MSTSVQTLVRPDSRASAMIRVIIGTVGFAALTALSAHIRIPLLFTPVPVTMQTFVVLMSGIILGPVLGSMSQGLYILLGLAGLPIFAASGAGAFLAGPTVGYLAGFVIAAGLTGWLASRGANQVVAVLMGMVAIYSCGVLWLAYGLGLGFVRALALGAWPFLLGDLVKGVALVFGTGLVQSRR